MTNNAAVTASGIIGLTWSSVNYDGGAPVIYYQISSKIGTGVYSVLALVNFPTTSFTASSFTADVVYTFKKTACNQVGFGTDSTEVNIRAAAKPDDPAAPFTEANSNISVSIYWVGP